MSTKLTATESQDTILAFERFKKIIAQSLMKWPALGAKLLDEESTFGVVGMQREPRREEFGGITWFSGGNREREGSLANSVLRGKGGLKEIDTPPQLH